MRSFTADEPFEPVAAGRPSGLASSTSGERPVRLWSRGGRLSPVGGWIVMGFTALGLILFAWQSFSEDGGFVALGVGTFALLWTGVFVMTEVRARRIVRSLRSCVSDRS
jgi:hypothetical protein